LLIEADSELTTIKEQNAERQRLLNERREEINRLDWEYRELKRVGEILSAEVGQIFAEATEEETGLIQEWIASGRTIDDLRAEIEGLTQRVGLLREGNPRTVEIFEKRQREIDKLEERVANFEADLERLNNDIAEVRAKWEPELDQVVAQISEAFSHNFAQIGCAGQVGVHKDEEDFSQWAIRIEVKFR
jgi:structural maintenance of chromosomes protein 5